MTDDRRTDDDISLINLVAVASTLCQTCSYLTSCGHHYLGHYQIILLGDRHNGVKNSPKVAVQQCLNGTPIHDI